MAQASAATIYVLNGPNLNMLGIREPEKYGHASLADVEKLCVETAAQFGLKADCRQSNREGELIDFIHEAHAKKVVGIIINAGGYSHTSIALHDALVAVKIPTVEVHISNIHARESFRHHSYTAMAAFASLCGFGIDGYRLAINGLAAKLGAKAKNLTSKPDVKTDTQSLTLQPSPTSRIPDQEHGPPARQQVSGQISRKPEERRQRAHSRTRAVAG